MFQGSFKLIKKNIHTDEVTYESDWIKNTVTLTHIQSRMNTNTPNATSRIGPNICIADWDGPVNERTSHLIRVHAIGTDVTAPTFNGNPDVGTDYFVEYQQTFSPPGADRDIQAIGVTNNSTSGGANNVDAWTSLVTTCTQTTTETLIVFYRVQFAAKTANAYNTNRQRAMSQAFGMGVNEGLFPVETVHTWQANLHNTESGSLVPGTSGTGLTFAGISSSRWTGTDVGPDATFDSKYFARRYTHSATISDAIGEIRGSILYRSNSSSAGRSIFWNNLLPPTAGKVQNIYSHNSSADKPFFDPLTVPTTTGTIAISSAAWTDPDYPFMYRVNVTGTGAVGVSTYQIQRRRMISGFQGNTFNSLAGVAPTSAINNVMYGDMTDNTAGSAFQDINSSPNNTKGEIPHAYNNRTVFLCDNSKMVFIDVITGEGLLSVNSTDFPAWGPTEIGQYEYDELSDTVWVSCANTGIYSVSDPLGSPTVTFHDVTGATGTVAGPILNQAYAIDLGVSQGGFRTVWAIVDGALVQSTDNGTTWVARDDTTPSEPFTFSFINTTWNRAISLRAHKTNADDQLGFLYHDGTTLSSAPAVFLGWWDRINDGADVWNHASEAVLRLFGMLTPQSGENRRMVHRMLGMSPTQGLWAMNGVNANFPGTPFSNAPVWFTYGSSTATAVSSGITFGGRTPSDNVSEAQRSTNHVNFGVDDLGQDFIFFGNEGQSDLFAINQAGAGTLLYANTDFDSNTPSSAISDHMLTYMGNGIFYTADDQFTSGSKLPGNRLFMYGRSTQPLGPTNYTDELWETYGFDGLNWVLGDPGSKTTHASSDVFLDGLTISFDDAGATQNFVATDYFSAGVVNGVQLDANTEYDWAGSLYWMPAVEGITAMEPAAVPGVTAIQNDPINADGNRLADYADTTANITITPTTSVPTNFDDITKAGTAGVHGTRINQPAEGDFCLWTDAFTESSIGLGDGTIFGVSSSAVIGTALNRDLVQFGFYISGTASLVDVFIRESGVNVATVETGLSVTALLTGLDMRIERVGTVVNYYFMEKLVHTSASAFAGNAVPEFVIGNGADARLVMREWAHTWTDTWSYVGTSGGSTGHYDPVLRVIDVNAADYSLTINGVEGTRITDRDRSTVLSAGEYSVFPETGTVRLAAADAALALAGNFTAIQSS